MKIVNFVPQTSRLLLTAGIGLLIGTAVQADTLSFTNAPASNVAAEMGRRYGVSIVFKGAVNGNQPLTFSVDNADTPGGRLQAISYLADALGMDYQKVYVVSKIDPGTTVPEVKIDSDGPVVFPTTKVSAREAIHTVAAVDGALVQISKLVQGSVVFPNPRMTAPEAAASIARQTQTVWRAYYGFFKHGDASAKLSTVVVGQGSDAANALPLLTFRPTRSHEVPISEFNDPNVGITPILSGGAAVTTVGAPNVPFDNPFGYSGLGYDPYGNFNPYGYPGYNYAYPGYPALPTTGVTTPITPNTNAPVTGIPPATTPTP
jgi:hypothetical protein